MQENAIVLQDVIGNADFHMEAATGVVGMNEAVEAMKLIIAIVSKTLILHPVLKWVNHNVIIVIANGLKI